MAQPWGVKLEQARWSFAAYRLRSRHALLSRADQRARLVCNTPGVCKFANRGAGSGFESAKPTKLRMGRHALHARKHIGFRWFRRDP